MKRLHLLVLALLCYSALLPQAQAQSQQQTITVTPGILPKTAPELVNPMRGYYRWYDSETCLLYTSDAADE